ncbi:MAG: cupin domain-containing protein [Ruminiclostridium sp.]|nr:cupin domain-containing protein [Ruminiclostridium sp.]
MIQPVENMETETRDKMRGGNGEIGLRHILKQNQLKGKCRLFSELVIKPGCSIGLHRHDGEEEIFYIVKGEGLADDNGSKQLLKAGDVMLTGDGASHSIENTGNVDLVIIAVILLY